MYHATEADVDIVAWSGAFALHHSESCVIRLFSNKENREIVDAERKRKLARMKLVRSSERGDGKQIRIGQKALVCLPLRLVCMFSGTLRCKIFGED